jgi:hypothetical protein
MVAPVTLLAWWYSRGMKLAVDHALQRIKNTFHLFSIPILLRTLFAPWKRIITPPGAGLDAHFRAAIDNMVSRTIGFIVRFFVLLTAGLLLLLSIIVSLIELMLWPLIPIAAPAAIITGIFLL